MRTYTGSDRGQTRVRSTIGTGVVQIRIGDRHRVKLRTGMGVRSRSVVEKLSTSDFSLLTVRIKICSHKVEISVLSRAIFIDVLSEINKEGWGATKVTN